MRLFAVLVIVTFCCFLTVAEGAEGTARSAKVEVVAHRGFSAAAPENTLSSVKKAIECGAQGCEIDIRATADGVIVLSHDDNFKRATGFDKPVNKMTFADVQKLDASSIKKEFVTTFKGEKVPTFEDVLKTLKGTSCKPIIEVKADGFEEEVVRLIQKYDLVDKCAIIDFSAKRVKKYLALDPKLTVAWLCSYDKKKYSESEVIEIVTKTLRDCGTNLVDIYYGNVSPAFLAAMKKEKCHVWCWTVDKEADVQRLLSLDGIESITSNRPDMVLKAVNAR